MKRIFAIIFSLALFTVLSAEVLAAKPEDNKAGARKIEWNLSADVMPVPPYGSYDIPDSDTASKLIVNEPNGKTEVAITGVMKELNPETTYTVYLSKGYTPYEFTGWDVSGLYTINLTIGATPYTEYLLLDQNGASITGSLALDPSQTISKWTIDSGTVDGNQIRLYAHFRDNLSQKLVMEGEIHSDGSISGTWEDTDWNTRSGVWSTTVGKAKETHTGSTGWSGLFTSTIPPFTFTTDEFGTGSWHINLTEENFKTDGVQKLSVWINRGGTLLISDTFEVLK